MFVGFCDANRVPAARWTLTVPGRLALLSLVLAVGACATPISVTRLDPLVAQQDLTRNVLYSGEPSSFSRIILNRQGLSEEFAKNPEAALKTLHSELVSGTYDISYIYALAELSFLHAQRGAPATQQQAYYLAAALYAYAFLFPPAGTAPVEAYDRRFRDACD
ncbi:MAG TPA: hypothetical protein VN648_10235, partial [Candidatus Methylomirabilis sp.]|nr:hypothetical protein [Candidatus Methylomirabilis sp.]